MIIHDMNAVPRLVGPALSERLRVMPAVVVSGARQTGKSTLAERLLAGPRQYRSLDDLDVLDAARRDPESLAGRASYLTLWPMTRREQLGQVRCGLWDELLGTPDAGWLDLLGAQPIEAEGWRALARRGGFATPALELTSARERAIWFDGYVRTYLERDLQDLASISALPDFRRLMRAACLRMGQLVNQTEIGRDAPAHIPRGVWPEGARRAAAAYGPHDGVAGARRSGRTLVAGVLTRASARSSGAQAQQRRPRGLEVTDCRRRELRAEIETLASNTQQPGLGRGRGGHPLEYCEHRFGRQRVRGVQEVGRGHHASQLERRRRARARIHEDHPLSPDEVERVLDLQLELADHLDARHRGRLDPRREFGPDGVVAAARVADR